MFRETVIIFFAIKGSDFLCPYSKNVQKTTPNAHKPRFNQGLWAFRVKIKNVVSSTKTNDKL